MYIYMCVCVCIYIKIYSISLHGTVWEVQQQLSSHWRERQPRSCSICETGCLSGPYLAIRSRGSLGTTGLQSTLGSDVSHRVQELKTQALEMNPAGMTGQQEGKQVKPKTLPPGLLISGYHQKIYPLGGSSHFKELDQECGQKLISSNLQR